MRFAALSLALLLTSRAFADGPEPDPAKVPTKPAVAPDEIAGSVIVIGYRGTKMGKLATRKQEEAKAIADEALAAARAKGSNYYDVVKKYSDQPQGRGVIPTMTVGQCQFPTLEAALVGMEIGQVSDVFESDLGYMIVMRLTARAASSHILIAYKGAERAAASVSRTKEEAAALAGKARDRVTTGGEDFAAVAKEISDCGSRAKGGDLGTFGRAAMAPQFEDAAFALKEGEISSVVETPFGFHVIRANKVEIPITWRASHILVRWKGTTRAPAAITRSKEEAKAAAEALLQRLKDGEDFAKLAAEGSDCPSKAKGGDLGNFGPGAMVPAFEAAVKGLEVGGLSGLVESEFGYHVIKRTK
jgi:parvulin-like peptidyl-prolyl isomerase